MTMPESQGRWSTLSKDIVSLISYAHSTISASVDACWPSPPPPGIDDTRHTLDLTTPTPTIVPSTPATRVVSTTTATPIAFNLVLYKDMFAVQLETTKALMNPKAFKSMQGGTPSYFLDLLTTVASTMVIVRDSTLRIHPKLMLVLFSQVLGQPVVRYLESSNPIASIPSDLESHPPDVFLGYSHSLIPSWISTSSSLIYADSVALVHNDDGVSLKELSLWGVYFATILVRSCSKPVVAPLPPPTETRTVHRLPLMIEAAEVLSVCWFRSHALPGSFSGGSQIQPLELKDKLDLLPPALELNPAIRPQAQDIVRPPASSTTNSLHLADRVDGPGSEITGPNQPENLALSFPLETRSLTKTELSHQQPDVSEPPLVRSFGRISGRRVTPLIQLEHGQVDDVSKVRSSLSLLKVISMDSLSLGECDLGFLSQFPAPPEKGESVFCFGIFDISLHCVLIMSSVPVRPLSLFEKADIRGVPFLKPPPSPTLDSIREFPLLEPP
jgi:hypothetical protein